MPGFRRAQLRGSEELFRTTEATNATVQEEIEVPVQGVSPTPTTVVPRSPDPGERSLRLNVEDLELLADAVQQLKFPGKVGTKPSIDDFERLEDLRKKLLEQI